MLTMEVTPVVGPGAEGLRVSRQLCRLEQPAPEYLAGQRAGATSTTRALRRRRGRATVGRAGGRSAVPRKPSSPAGATAITIQYHTWRRRVTRPRRRSPVTGGRTIACVVYESFSRVRVPRSHVSVILVFECVYLPSRIWRVNVPCRKFVRAKVSPDALCDKFNRFVFFLNFISIPPPIRSDLFNRFPVFQVLA